MARVWSSIVDYAITQDVDVVALTGDVVDQENRFYESYGPLKQGLTRLAQCGIDTVAVAGNHDYNVFPHLVDALEADRFHLLGRGGAWSTARLRRNGQVVRFVGWSFPARHVRSSPLEELSLDATDVPTIGLLHGDLDQAGSDYAPVMQADLSGVPVDAWLMGHIHKPTHLSGSGPLVLYPGSPQPLDPGEEAAHGPWRVTLDGAGRAQAQQVPLASVRYDTIEVDVGGVSDKESFRNVVIEAVETTGQTHADLEALQRLVYRLRCTGRTPLHRELEALREEIEGREIPIGSVTATVDGLTLNTHPDIDLEAVAERSDPPGVLAQVILDLKNGDKKAHSELLRRAQERCERVQRANKYAPLRQARGAGQMPDQEVRSLLVGEGLRLLDQLLAQKAPDDQSA